MCELEPSMMVPILWTFPPWVTLPMPPPVLPLIARIYPKPPTPRIYSTQGRVLPLNLNQNNGMVSIRNKDQTSTAPEQQPIAAQMKPEDIVLTNEKPEMTFEKTDQDVLQNKSGGQMG